MSKLAREKEKLKSHYTKLLAQMVSDTDFSRFLDDVDGKVIKYSELSHFNTIDELLPSNPFDYRIVLTEDSYNQGHWCCLVKTSKNIVWFDSYGVRPDGELSLIPASVRRMLGEDHYYLTRIIKSSYRKVSYNKIRYQVLQTGVNTCGKWSTLFILMSKFGYSLKEFQTFMQKQKEESGKPFDILVCDWIQ